ncbi:MAG: D-glycero-beta-D-manno-heptose 1,7-bisphosphate 7-phosphatase [Candidatus Sungbacteria bacterium]|nr:D-glycero-beta-D-manno-heptose 1,7-bisphosphate 7-phosphatase [Candidatus Sungbacteria bacterium]
MKKIMTLTKLAYIAGRFKAEGKTVVAVNGSFDILHSGHVRSLREAKSRGDVLMVLVNSDESVRLYKGPSRHIVPQEERLEMLAALDTVDYVALFDEINAKHALDRIRPNVYCHGSQWGKNCIERETIERNNGRIHILRQHPGRSTTDIAQKILEAQRALAVRAVFLDRDGTINNNGEKGYTYRVEDFRFLPGVIPALQRLSKTDYKIIVVTNQSGIARGYYTEAQMHTLHRWMTQTLKQKGGRIDRVYHCPHAPEDSCDCRKPKIKMFLRAVKDFGISLDKSWFVGDGETDVIAGREANIKTIKIGARMPRSLKLEPHGYAKDLDDAVSLILAKK